MLWFWFYITLAGSWPVCIQCSLAQKDLACPLWYHVCITADLSWSQYPYTTEWLWNIGIKQNVPFHIVDKKQRLVGLKPWNLCHTIWIYNHSVFHVGQSIDMQFFFLCLQEDVSPQENKFHPCIRTLALISCCPRFWFSKWTLMLTVAVCCFCQGCDDSAVFSTSLMPKFNFTAHTSYMNTRSKDANTV